MGENTKGLTVRDRIACEGCGRYDLATTHWCGADNGLTRARGRAPVCCYCWGPVAPRLGKRGQLLATPDWCSDACKRLLARPAGARSTAATRDLICAVAATSSGLARSA